MQKGELQEGEKSKEFSAEKMIGIAEKLAQPDVDFDSDEMIRKTSAAILIGEEEVDGAPV